MAETPTVGTTAPDFTLESTEGPIHLAAWVESASVVLLFYVEDSTPLCESQLGQFHGDREIWAETGARLVGISTDGLDAHTRFAASFGPLSYPLASDPGGQVAQAYGVYDPEQKRARRAAFVIGPGREVLAAIPHYSPGNVEQYLAIGAALGME